MTDAMLDTVLDINLDGVKEKEIVPAGNEHMLAFRFVRVDKEADSPRMSVGFSIEDTPNTKMRYDP